MRAVLRKFLPRSRSSSVAVKRERGDGQDRDNVVPSGIAQDEPKSPSNRDAPVELSARTIEFIDQVMSEKLTMVSKQRLWATAKAVRYIIDENIPGDFVECGVWRGGNSLLASHSFKEAEIYDRRVWLFDTFNGMTAPTDADVRAETGKSANERFEELQRESHNDWCYAPIDDVRKSFERHGLLSDRVVFVQGDVAETLTVNHGLPEKISVLRLDTDWYESTRIELEVLWPRLEPGGILIVDDYGYWAGSKTAVDEYFSKLERKPFLNYIDNTGRLAVKF